MVEVRSYSSNSTEGGGVTLGDFDKNGTQDLLLMVVNDSKGDNHFSYRIGWDLQANGQALSWSDSVKLTTIPLASTHIGGGAAFGDIDGDGTAELAFMGTTNQGKSEYIVGRPDSEDGSKWIWSSLQKGPAPGSYKLGSGAVITRLDDHQDANTRAELIFMGMNIDKTHKQTAFQVRVGWNINDAWQPGIPWGSSLTAPADQDFQIPHPSADLYQGGGGAAVKDINGNNIPDLFLMGVENGEAPKLHFRIGHDLDTQGNPVGWQGFSIDLPFQGAGAGAAIEDLDGDGNQDLVLMVVEDKNNIIDMDYPENSGRNDFHYMIGWKLGADGQPASWSPFHRVEGIGRDTSGGGIIVRDIDGNGFYDIILMGIKQPDGEIKDPFGRAPAQDLSRKIRYRIGWDLSPVTWTSDRWSGIVATDLPSSEFGRNGGGLALIEGDGDAGPDLLVACPGPTGLYYTIAKNLNSQGEPETWSDFLSVPGFNSSAYPLAGAAIGDLGGDGILDLILTGSSTIATGEESASIGFRYRLLPNYTRADWGLPISTADSLYLAKEHGGAGTALVDIDGNGRSELIKMAIETGSNKFVYTIDWDLNSDGKPTRPGGKPFSVSGIEPETQGGGATAGLIDDDSMQDLVFMGVAHTGQNNRFRYKIGWDMGGADGKPSKWSDVVEIDVPLAGETTGGGAALADFDKNGKMDLLLMAVQSLSGTDHFEYTIAFDLDPVTGVPERMLPYVFNAEGIGDRTEGGGVAVADLNNNGKLELIFMGVDDPKGANNIRYRIGWDIGDQWGGIPFVGGTGRWSRVIKTAEAQLLGTNAGGGAAAADIDQDGMTDLFFGAVDDSIGGKNRFRLFTAEGADTQTMPLAHFSAPFFLTGFIAQENLGTHIGVFAARGEPDETARAYSLLEMNFLNGELSMADAYQQIGNPESASGQQPVEISGEISAGAHMDEAAQISSQTVRTLLKAYPGRAGVPLVTAITSASATVDMKSLMPASYVTAPEAIFTLDLAQKEQTVTRSLKLSWYDTSGEKDLDTSALLPMNFGQVIDLAQTWGMDNTTLKNVLSQLMVWDIGETRVRQIGKTQFAPWLDPDYRHQTTKWAATGIGGLGGLCTLGIKIQQFFIWDKLFWTKGASFKDALKAAKAYGEVAGKSKMPGRISTKIGNYSVLKSSPGLSVCRTLNKAFKTFAVVGAAVSSGLAVYTGSLIIKHQGLDSSFGWASASTSVTMNLAYIISTLKLTLCTNPWTMGASFIISLSDTIVSLITGSGWSQIAIQKLMEWLTDVYVVTGVDLEVLDSTSRLEDPGGNGLTAGDRFSYSSRIKSIAYEEENASDDDMDDTYIKPRAFISGAGTSSSRNHYNEKDFGDERWDYYEVSAELDLDEAAINYKRDLVIKYEYCTVYRECFGWSCDTEYSKDDSKQTIPLYFDVLPDSLDGVIQWSKITPVNTAPLGSDRGFKMTNSGSSGLTMDLLTHAWDAENDPLEIVILESPAHGTLTLGSGGQATYLPDNSQGLFNGSDRFRYQLRDPGGKLSQELEATILVRRQNTPPSPVSDSHRIPEDLEAVLHVLANDTDPDQGDQASLRITHVSQPATGTLVNHGTHLTYTPVENWTGTLDFQYVVSDGIDPSAPCQVNVEVYWVNDPPAAEPDTYTVDEDGILNAGPETGVLANDSDEEGTALRAALVSGLACEEGKDCGTLSLEPDGALTYQPAPDYYGQVRFAYRATEAVQNEDPSSSLISEPVTVTIQVNSVNDPPETAADTYTLLEDDIMEIGEAQGVLANDFDKDSPLKAELVTGPKKGHLELIGHGGFRYIPERNFAGRVEFTYKAYDGFVRSDPVAVTIIVNEAYDNPLAVDDRYEFGSGLFSAAAPGVMANDMIAMAWSLPDQTQTIYTGLAGEYRMVGYAPGLTDSTTQGFMDSPGTLIRYPGANLTQIWDISTDHTLIGVFRTPENQGAFTAIQNGNTWEFSPIQIPNAEAVHARGINDQGRHAGFFLRNGVILGYWYDGNGIQELDLVAGFRPQGLNAGEIIAGYKGDVGTVSDLLPDPVQGDYHGGILDPRTLAFETLKVPGASTVLTGINDMGIVAGSFAYPGGRAIPFAAAADADGKYHFSAIPMYVNNPGVALGISNRGVVTGYQMHRVNLEPEYRGFISKPFPAMGRAQLKDAPKKGSLSLEPNGQFTYTYSPQGPDDPCDCEDRFTYTATDGRDPSNTATVVIRIIPRDQDKDGILDCVDPDDDGDGIEDILDPCPLDPGGTDSDGDGIPDGCDNCPQLSNPGQRDYDKDGHGDPCDENPCMDEEGRIYCDELSQECPDLDWDTRCDNEDNCPAIPNEDQADWDNDDIGDACDLCQDKDEDNICDEQDNCPEVENSYQEDWDDDGIGDPCDTCMDMDRDSVCEPWYNTQPPWDNCPEMFNPDQIDADNDGIGDVCDDCVDPDEDGICQDEDTCPNDMNVSMDEDDDGVDDACDTCIDLDRDGICYSVAIFYDKPDNCPEIPNKDQEDSDNDGIGDVCDTFPDKDGDGIQDIEDNCPTAANQEQADVDMDGIGDACDPCEDKDKDKVCDPNDNCICSMDNPIICDDQGHCMPFSDPMECWAATYNPLQKDSDNDGIGDLCDTFSDKDRDGIEDGQDNCRDHGNPGQADTDGDGIGDACDNCEDKDMDMVCDQEDNCPQFNPDQADADEDGIGEPCDDCVDRDRDNICDPGDDCIDPDDDGHCNGNDNCPDIANEDQADNDADGEGDACDACTDADQNGICETLGSYWLSEGWNLFSLPRVPLAPYTAASLLQEMSIQGCQVKRIQAWDGSGWQSFAAGSPFGDFSIEPDKGYFLESRKQGTWRSSGHSIQDLFNCSGILCLPENSLMTGWRLIRLVDDSPNTAETLLEALKGINQKSARIQAWDGSGWQTYSSDTPFGDFDLDLDEGVFLLIKD